MKNRKPPSFNLKKFLLSILIVQLAGVIGSFATYRSVKTWYPLLNKPFFNPPSWIFAPVWTFLFLLMGFSLYLVWNKKNNLFWFWVQLLLNILWSYLFFGLQSPALAFYEIILLWITIVITISKFWKYNKIASYLLLPYLFWVSFASILNFATCRLN